MNNVVWSAVTFAGVFSCVPLLGQGTLADYVRAQGLRAKARDLVVNSPGPVTWIGDTDRFWYPRTVKGGNEYILGDAAAGTRGLAFDHEKLAVAISRATGKTYKTLALPFGPRPVGRGGGGRGATESAPTTAPLAFLDDGKTIQFGTDGTLYKCSLNSYECRKEGP